MARFDRAIQTVLGEEGGYVNDPSDPGGETHWGISKRSYPDLNIAALTREDAVAIYRSDYWDRHKIALIHDQDIAERYFSFVVNMGARSAGRIVQRALRAVGSPVEEDGWVGTNTRKAINDWTSQSWVCSLLAAIRSEAAGHYRLLIEKNPSLERFRNGWMNRAYS